MASRAVGTLVSSPVLKIPLKLHVSKHPTATKVRPLCHQVKLLEKVKPLDNSTLARDSAIPSVSSANDSAGSSGQHDEEVSASEEDDNLKMPTNQISAVKKNKFALEANEMSRSRSSNILLQDQNR